MEERLKQLLRLALKYNGNDIRIYKNHDEIFIDMRVDGILRKVKYKLGDEKLLGYMSYICGMDDDNSNAQTEVLETIVDGMNVKCRVARLNDLMVIRLIEREVLTNEI